MIKGFHQEAWQHDDMMNRFVWLKEAAQVQQFCQTDHQLVLRDQPNDHRHQEAAAEKVRLLYLPMKATRHQAPTHAKLFVLPQFEPDEYPHPARDAVLPLLQSFLFFYHGTTSFFP
jgi:hypothetical protein